MLQNILCLSEGQDSLIHPIKVTVDDSHKLGWGDFPAVCDLYDRISLNDGTSDIDVPTSHMLKNPTWFQSRSNIVHSVCHESLSNLNYMNASCNSSNIINNKIKRTYASSIVHEVQNMSSIVCDEMAFINASDEKKHSAQISTRSKKIGVSDHGTIHRNYVTGDHSAILYEASPITVSQSVSSGKHVRFSTVSVREYRLTLGNHPYACHYPLSLDWVYEVETVCCIFDYGHTRELLYEQDSTSKTRDFRIKYSRTFRQPRHFDVFERRSRLSHAMGISLETLDLLEQQRRKEECDVEYRDEQLNSMLPIKNISETLEI